MTVVCAGCNIVAGIHKLFIVEYLAIGRHNEEHINGSVWRRAFKKMQHRDIMVLAVTRR
jgi:hypothetical protein